MSLKPILGCEFFVCEDHLNKSHKDYGYQIVMLAKNKNGYQNLVKMASIAYTDGFYYVPRIDKKVVEKYKEEYHIIQVCKPSSRKIPEAEVIDQEMSNIDLFTLLTHSSKRILIDSSLQHAAAAMNLPSTVLWVATSPTIFGYELHNNIIADFPRDQVKLPDSYIFAYNFNGETHECPLLDYNIFNADEILKTL